MLKLPELKFKDETQSSPHVGGSYWNVWVDFSDFVKELDADRAGKLQLHMMGSTIWTLSIERNYN